MTDIRRSLGYSAPVKTRYRLPVILLIFLLLPGAFYGLWWFWQQQLAERQNHDRLVQHQFEQLLHSRDTLSAELSGLRREQEGLRGRLDTLGQSLSPVERRQWLANETAYYLDLAEQHLQLQQDVTPALRLIELADSLLAPHADPGLARLREGLAADRLELMIVQQVDHAGLSLRLDALKQQATRLALPMRAGQPPSGSVDKPVAAPHAAVWEKGWQSFRELITIRRYDAPVRPLLGDDQRWLLQQSVYLELTQAQLALWRNQNSRYHQSLANVQALLKDYAAMDTAFSALQQELGLLAVQNLPAIPLTLPKSRLALTALKDLHPVTAGAAQP